MPEVIPIDRFRRQRWWASARTRYAAISEVEAKALSLSEVVKGYFATLPEPPGYARAWYEQNAKQFHYHKMLPSELVVTTLSADLPTKEFALVILEMDRRARRDGYVAIGEWGEANLEFREKAD
jgi:hypothetical protein